MGMQQPLIGGYAAKFYIKIFIFLFGRLHLLKEVGILVTLPLPTNTPFQS